MRASFSLLKDAKDYYGLVVEVGGASLKVGNGLKDGVDRRPCGGVVLRLEEFDEAFVAKHLTCAVDGVDDAVGEKDN